MKKSTWGWLFAVIGLIILLGISIYLGVSGWYFNTDFSQESDIVLGNTVEIEVGKNQANTCSFSFSGAILPGEQLPQIISVKNKEEEGKLYLRAKVYVFMENSTIASMSLISTSNWTLAEDGYYYYNDLLVEKGKTGLCSHVIVDDDGVLRGNKNYIMTVLVESLSQDCVPMDIWSENPLSVIKPVATKVSIEEDEMESGEVSQSEKKFEVKTTNEDK